MKPLSWKTALLGLIALASSTLAASCGKVASNAGTDSSTHWLEHCAEDSECGELRCVCGTCTQPCADASECPDVDVAECTLAQGSCGQQATVCVALCAEDPDCSSVRSGLRCVGGQCQTVDPGGQYSADQCQSIRDQIMEALETNIETGVLIPTAVPCGQDGIAMRADYFDPRVAPRDQEYLQDAYANACEEFSANCEADSELESAQ